MNSQISIDAVIGELDLMSTSIDASEKLMKVYKLFDVEHNISGIIVTQNNTFFKMLSRKRFFEIMSKQFMFDLFLKRTVGEFFDEKNEGYLRFPSETPVLTVASQALRRQESQIHDPVLVEFRDGSIKLLDFYKLLLAQTQVHLLASNQLKEANEFKKDVLGILAHDLRSPINVILGFTQELNRISWHDEEARSYLDYIRQATYQMKDLVDGLMKSAFNDSFDFELSYTKFNLIDLIDSVVFSFGKNLEAKNQRIVFETGDDQILLNADKQKIKEVLENLLSNAIKYSNFGKSIRVAVGNIYSEVEIEISDEGQGFSKEDLTKIFGKFQKLSAKPTNNESSTGLGLYIVNKIITKHQGKILLESEINQGSTFKILLPNNQIDMHDNKKIPIDNKKLELH